MLQAEKKFYPMLATFGTAPEASASTSSAGTDAGWNLAQNLGKWRDLQNLLAALTAACINLLEQLGALCAAQTRKATILQGKYHTEKPHL